MKTEADKEVDEFVARMSARNPFQPYQGEERIAVLENLLPARFPHSFRSLITRYEFPPLEPGVIDLFGNMGTDDNDELAVAIFKDDWIAKITREAGFIHFAKDGRGSYDPICFDTNRAKGMEYPIVRLDHEEILQNDRVEIVWEYSESFFSVHPFLERKPRGFISSTLA